LGETALIHPRREIMMSDVQCPRCANWAPMSGGKLGRHKSNEPSLTTNKITFCPAAGKSPAAVRAEMSPEDVVRRDHLKRTKPMRLPGFSRNSTVEVPVRRNRGRFTLDHCVACDKAWYTSYAQAQRMVIKVLAERETQLYIYHCPVDSEQYHVTKEEFHRDRGEVL
jgi:hypothetical protein